MFYFYALSSSLRLRICFNYGHTFLLVSKILQIFIIDISGSYAEPHYPDDPPVYHYTYTVDDDVTGAQIFADEARDEDKTQGMYEVNF